MLVNIMRFAIPDTEFYQLTYSKQLKRSLPRLTTLIMPLLTVNGVWRLTFTLLTISSGGLVRGMHTSLSDMENERMQNGSLIYSLLSTRQQIVLFKNFMTANSRQVIFYTNFTELCDQRKIC